MNLLALSILIKKNLKYYFSLNLKLLTFLTRPLVWLLLFLFLRQNKVFIELGQGKTDYAHFIILGIAVWRMITMLMSYIAQSANINKNVLRTILNTVHGKKIFFLSTLISAFVLSIVVGAVVILAGVLLYDFSVYFEGVFISLLVVLMILISHFGLALIFLSLSFNQKNFKDFAFLITTILALLSGVFFPAEFFPSPLNTLSFIFPLTQGIYLLHGLLLFPLAQVHWGLFIGLLVETLVLFYLGKRLYFKQINKLFK